MCLELLWGEAATLMGMRLRLAGSSSLHMAVCALTDSWESPLIGVLWESVNCEWQQSVLFVAGPGIDACSYYVIHFCGFFCLGSDKRGARTH